MNKFYFIFLLFFTICIAACQKKNNYIKYYNLCNLGDKEKYFENYEVASQNYQAAFKEVDYVHADTYRKAAECAVQTKDYARAATYYKKSYLNGYELTFHVGDSSFNQSTYGIELNKAIPDYFAQAKQQFNQEYQTIIDSLYYIDQNIIRGGYAEGVYQIDRTQLPANLFDLDKQVFATLMDLVVKYGFPAEPLVSPKTYGKAAIIFHHNIRLPENSQYMDFAITALKNGQYHPSNFAWMYDQSLTHIGKKPLFYYGVPGIFQLSDAEKAMADEERKKYGIKPIESTKFEETADGISMMTLW